MKALSYILLCLGAALGLVDSAQAQRTVQLNSVNRGQTRTSVPSVTQVVPRVGFDANPAAIVEGSATLALTLKLSKVSIHPVQVQLQSVGTAELDVDFTLDMQTVVIPAGQTSAQVQLTALSDGMTESIETIDLELVYPRLAHLGEGASHRIHISDSVGSGSSAGGVLTSDDFDRCGGFDPIWTAVDPLGDSTSQVLGVGSGQVTLRMDAPAGTEHQAWNSLSCPQVLQSLGTGDFEAEVAFMDRPDSGEIYGLLIKQDGSNWIRCDFYNYGGTLYAFVGRTKNGRTRQKLNTAVSFAGTQIWMRVARVGNRYYLRISGDGVLWTTLTSFRYNFAPVEMGPYLGNFGSNPAADVEVDYVFDVESPIVPEDSGAKSNPTLAVSVTGSGSTSANPVGPTYACGVDVTLTATADPGWIFSGWAGDATGGQPSIVVNMDGPKDVTAVFVSSSSPPLLSNIQVVPSHGDAVVTWDTDQPATSRVDFGLSAAYGNQVSSAALVTSHQLVLPGLSEQTTYHFQVTSDNAAADSTQSVDDTFVTPATPVAVLVSDDFNVCGDLDPAWTFVGSSQADDSYGLQGAGTSDAQLALHVPGGSDHQAWTTLNCPRIMQDVPDTDFEIEVKFDSEMSSAYQMQGIVIEQDATHWLRFDLYSHGSGVSFYAGATDGGGTLEKANGPLLASAPYYLRVARSGNQWTFEHSPDGNGWSTLANFSQALNVASVGPYAGNAGPSGPSSAPAFTALCDYVFDTAGPIAPEDGPTAGTGPFTLTTGVPGGGGSIQASPSSADYACGDAVSLTAIADGGYHFVAWGGDANGASNPLDLTVQGDLSITAQFALDAVNPTISNVSVVASHQDALISWTTDLASDSLVNFGATQSYGSQVSDGAHGTDHQLLLTGLDPETLYHFQVVSNHASGGLAASSDDEFTTEAAPVTALVSDDFNGCGGLGPAWTFQDSPAADATYALLGVGTSDAQLRIDVPAGSDHQAWTNLNCPRVMQNVSDTDFQMEVKFDSELNSTYQLQGILVQQDPTHWLRFDLYSHGGGVSYYAGATNGGGTVQKANGPLVGSAPYYLRLARSGNQWTFEHSSDGSSWATLANFSQALNVQQVGPYAGNAGASGPSSAPAFTALCDYVFDTSNPVVPEDGPTSGSGPFTLSTSVSGGGGTIQVSPASASYDCGDPVTLTATANSGYHFVGWGGHASGVSNPLGLNVNGDMHVTAQFTQDNGAPIISNVVVTPGANSATVTWDTLDPADGSVDYGLTVGLGSTEGHANLVTSHMVVLSGLDPVTQYHYQITSADIDGDSTVHPIAPFTTQSIGSIASDDFHEANLDLGVWTFTDPQDVAQLSLVGSGTSDAYLELQVPAGVVYEPWMVNGAARISQPVANEDFGFQAKFENAITESSTTTGLFVEQDVDDWIRLDYYFNGTDLNVFSARFVAGSPSSMDIATVQSGAWTSDDPLYLKVTRQGNLWVTEYSLEGQVWLPVGSFTSGMVPSKVGVMAGNSTGSANPQTVRVDWFESVLLPIQNEDPAVGADTTEPFVYDVDEVPLSENAVQISWATDELSTGSVQWGTTAAYGMVPATSVTPAYSHTVTLLGLNPDTTYHFQVDAEDAAFNLGSTLDQTVATHKLPGVGEPEIEFWYGLPDGMTGAHGLSFGTLGNGQNQFNVLGRVTDSDQDRIALEVNFEYRLNGGPWLDLTLGDDRTFNYDPWRLVNEGDFNLELYVDQLMGAPLVGGVHRSTVEFRATDDGGHVTLSTALVDYTPSVTWIDTLTVSWSDVANNLAGRIEEAVQIVDGKWEVFDDPNLGHVLRPDPNHLGYDRLVSIGEGHGDDGWDNYEALLPVTVHSFDPQGFTTGTASYGMGFVLRWTGHTENGPFSQPNHGLYPLGGLYVYRWFTNTERWELWIDENEDILPQPGNEISLGVTYWYRIRCEDAPSGGTTYSLKVWEDGLTEPAAWTFEHTTNPGDPKKGSLVLVAHHVNASFGDVVVTHLP